MNAREKNHVMKMLNWNKRIFFLTLCSLSKYLYLAIESEKVQLLKGFNCNWNVNSCKQQWFKGKKREKGESLIYGN